MKLLKTALMGGFAVGMAVAVAPLAAADDLTTAVDSEISAMNSIYDAEAFLSGIPATDIATDGNSFDYVSPLAAPQTDLATLYDLVFGINPDTSGTDSVTASYDVFNGALAEFSNAYNTELYSLLNNGVALPETLWSTDLFGPEINWDVAFVDGTATASHAVTSFLTDGWNDLLGYFDIASLLPN